MRGLSHTLASFTILGACLASLCHCSPNLEVTSLTGQEAPSPAPQADTISPEVTSFSMPAAATNLTVAVTAFTGSDDAGVAAYLITESAMPPDSTSLLWSSTAPASFTFSSAGSRTAYAWVKDSSGNLSASRSANVTITLGPNTAALYSPYNGITVSGTVQLSTSTNIDSGSGANVSKVEYYVNGSLYKTYSTATDSSNFSYNTTVKNRFSVVWDTSALSNGIYAIHSVVHATDGTLITSPTHTVAVSNTGYPITIPTGTPTVPARAQTVHIEGGTLSSPYAISGADTRYVLDGDIVADSTAISIQASSVTIDLNGHSITYNTKAPGGGIVLGTYNKSDIVILNGAIIQGPAMSESDQYGRGTGPITVAYMSPTPPFTVTNYAGGTSGWHISNVYARYGGRDTSGFYLAGDNALVENCYLEDMLLVGTVKNRHQGIDAIRLGINATARNNTIINTRHRGINVASNSLIHDNDIGVRSLCTNSYGVYLGVASGSKIYSNRISGRGEHAIGIGCHESSGNNFDNEIYGNTIDTKVTRLGTEYGGDITPINPATIYKGDYAAGIRSTSGTDGLKVHDNVITVSSDSDYPGTYSINGAPIRINAGARGIMTALRLPSDTAEYYDNSITVLDRDGTGNTEGLACGGANAGGELASQGLVFRRNTVTTNGMNIVLGNEYGMCLGWPLFIQNTLIKQDNFPSYATIGTGYNGYDSGTGRLISNAYGNGASESSLKLYFETRSPTTTLVNAVDAAQTTLRVADVSGMSAGHFLKIDDESMTISSISGTNVTVTRGAHGSVAAPHALGATVSDFTLKKRSVIFGRLLDVTVRNSSSAALPNAGLTVRNRLSSVESAATTSASGTAQIIVNDYELNNNNGTTGSAIPVRIDFRPHTIEVESLFTTAPDASGSAWDALASSGAFILSDPLGSITVTVP